MRILIACFLSLITISANGHQSSTALLSIEKTTNGVNAYLHWRLYDLEQAIGIDRDRNGDEARPPDLNHELVADPGIGAILAGGDPGNPVHQLAEHLGQPPEPEGEADDRDPGHQPREPAAQQRQTVPAPEWMLAGESDVA